MVRWAARGGSARDRLCAAAVLGLVAATIGSGEPAFGAQAPPPSTGAPVIESVAVTPQDVVLAGPHSAGVRVRMRITDPNGVDSAFAGLFGPRSENGRAFRLKRVSGSKRDGIWQAKGGLPASATPGDWRIQGFAVDTAQHSSDADDIYGSFAVRAATRFDQFTVTRSQSGLDLRATLRRWAGRDWAAVADGVVDVQFRPADAAAYGTVGSVHTGPDGTVVAAAHDGVIEGTWRVTYAGDELSAPATSGDAKITPPSPSPAAPAGARPDPTAAPRAIPSAEPRGLPSAEPNQEADAPADEPTARPTASLHPAPTARPVGTARPFPTARPTLTARPATAGPTATARPIQGAEAIRPATGRAPHGPARTVGPVPTAGPDPTPAALPPRAPGRPAQGRRHSDYRQISRPRAGRGSRR
jgi:hypothetical protein